MSIPLRVLVCDDELMARKRVLRLLSELPGIEATFECESGEQVLAKLDEEDVDVAILDINMPGLSGLERPIRAGVFPASLVLNSRSERSRLCNAP